MSMKPEVRERIRGEMVPLIDAARQRRVRARVCESSPRVIAQVRLLGAAVGAGEAARAKTSSITPGAVTGDTTSTAANPGAGRLARAAEARSPISVWEPPDPRTFGP